MFAGSWELSIVTGDSELRGPVVPIVDVISPLHSEPLNERYRLIASTDLELNRISPCKDHLCGLTLY